MTFGSLGFFSPVGSTFKSTEDVPSMNDFIEPVQKVQKVKRTQFTEDAMGWGGGGVCRIESSAGQRLAESSVAGTAA